MQQYHKQKNIDVIVKYFLPVAAGIETNIVATYSVLVKKGWNVTIHTSKDTLTEKNVLPKTATIKGIHIKRYRYHFWGYIPDINWKKTNIVALHNFNIFPHFLILLYSLLLKILQKKHFVLMLTPHGGFNPEWSIFSKFTQFVKKFYHFTIGTFLINLTVDKIRAVSEWEKLEILKKNVQKNKIITISNGIEDEAYMNIEKNASTKIKKIVKKYGRYIIQIGRIYSIKNYETTIKSLQLLPKDIKFVIVGPVGDKIYLEELQKLSQRLGVEKRVIFHGVVHGVDKYYLIKNAQLMVHMAIWESFCNAVHEGLSQGLVCIVANNTALPLLVIDGVNGFCIPTKNYRVLANKILYVLKHKDGKIIDVMQELNRSYGLRESWQNVALKMDELYTALMENQVKNKKVSYVYDK